MNTIINHLISCKTKLFHQLSNYKLFKDSAPWGSLLFVSISLVVAGFQVISLCSIAVRRSAKLREPAIIVGVCDDALERSVTQLGLTAIPRELQRVLTMNRVYFVKRSENFLKHPYNKQCYRTLEINYYSFL